MNVTGENNAENDQELTDAINIVIENRSENGPQIPRASGGAIEHVQERRDEHQEDTEDEAFLPECRGRAAGGDEAKDSEDVRSQTELDADPSIGD